jgi:hypothetical protein
MCADAIHKEVIMQRRIYRASALGVTATALSCLAMMLAFNVKDVAAADVGVSISVGQPGFYGRIDLGRAPPPQVLYQEPIIVQRPVVLTPPPNVYAPVSPVPVYAAPAPIYLRVPPGHSKKWHKHCYRYNACGQPVYFVQERWYQNTYVPYYKNEYKNKHRNH